MDYAQARLQARFGERPDEPAWQRLNDAGSLSTVLEMARASGLRHWVAGIDASSDSHWIEISLRARWRECVAETAAWMPPRWQPAAQWTSRLADLPALCHLARGEAPYAWMSLDPILRPYAIVQGELRAAKLRQDALAFAEARRPLPGAPVPEGEALESSVRRAWRAHWRRLWPGRGEARALEDLAELLESRFKEPMAAARQTFLHRLRKQFRSATLHPAAAFVYLAFAALDIERLRAELLGRALLRQAGIAS